MNISSGGLAILAIAAIWFLVFLPSFVKGDQSKVTEREKRDEAEVSVKNRLGEHAQRALRARRTRTIFASVSVTAFVVAGLSVLELAVSGSGLPMTIGSVAATAIGVWLTYRAHVNYREMLAGTVRRSVPISTPITTSVSTPALVQNTWQPESLPKQSFLQTGAIEIVELAEIVELESSDEVKPEISIDEILRRRRHVG